MRVGVYRKKALKIMEEAGKQGETTWEMVKGGGESGGWGPRPFLASHNGDAASASTPVRGVPTTKTIIKRNIKNKYYNKKLKRINQ